MDDQLCPTYGGAVIHVYISLFVLIFFSVWPFCRLAISGETLIRGDPNEVCRRVRGWDANSLYSFSMSQEMPTGVCQTRTAPDFVKKAPSSKGGNHSKVSLEWLDFEAHKRGVTIFNASNGPEVKIGAGRVTLDGFEPTSCTAFLFQGCFWHACECQEGRDEDGRSAAKRARIEEMFGTSMEDIRRRDAMLRDYIAGYCKKVIVMKECLWNAAKKDTTSAEYAFINSRRPSRLGNLKEMPKGPADEQAILSAIRDGRLFGAALVDLATPHGLKERFHDLPPIFKHAEIGMQDLSEHMKQYCQDNNITKVNRKSLISSYYGREILVITPLLRWYMQQGLVVTKVYMTLEWEPRRCFEFLTKAMADSRREADRDPNLKVMGEAAKLLANSVYGKTITNKARYLNTKLCRGRSVSYMRNRSRYRGHKRLSAEVVGSVCTTSGRHQEDRSLPLQQLVQDGNAPEGTPDYEAQEDALIIERDAIYELTSAPTQIKEDLPLHIALFTYQNAKLHMLRFRYDFLEVFLDKRKWQQQYSDTDSLYLSMSVDRLEEACFPHMRRAFFEQHDTWLPAECCEDHKDLYVSIMSEREEEASAIRAAGGQATAALAWMPRMRCCQMRHDSDQREPGLFKEEWVGEAMVSLCSKTYFCLPDEFGSEKYSCKGIQKSGNRLTFEHYLKVLRGDTTEATQLNRGIRVNPRTGAVETYSQRRTGLAYFYCKRKVREDGITTDPLDL